MNFFIFYMLNDLRISQPRTLFFHAAVSQPKVIIFSNYTSTQSYEE